MAGKYQLKTDGDYDFGEVISSLQKTIRRGDEQQAMYWALELFPKYQKTLWRRLTVIVNEDIGLGEPECIVLVETLRHQFDLLEKEASKRLVLSNCILALCRADKSRLADHFQCVINQRRLQKRWRLEIPDYAMDKHTRKGKAMGRGWEHWKTIGTQLQNEAKLYDPYYDEAHELWPTMKETGDGQHVSEKIKTTATLPFESESDD